jgi:hypothetical protein
MKIDKDSEARQNFYDGFNTALNEEVIIISKDGRQFKILSISENAANGKSPLEGIKGVMANITTEELVDVIREGREGSEYLKKY